MPSRFTRWILALATIASSLLLAACGGDDDDGGPSADSGPATVVPADAVVYVDGVVRPEDEQRESVETALQTVLGEDDPGGFLVGELEDEFSAGDVEVDYEEDIEPWLGERGAAFFLNFGESSDGAFVVETTDEELARDSIQRLIEQEGGVRPATYEGVEYTRTSEDDAAGIVDGFAVLGSQAGFESVVDAAAAESLAESDAYTSAVDAVPDDRLATVYAEPRTVLDVVIGSGDLTEAQADAIAEAVGPAVDAPVVLSLGADDAGFFAELATEGEAPIGGSSDLLEQLPDDAWAAFALSDAGSLAGPAILGSLGSNEVLGSVLRGLQDQIGIDLAEFGASVGDVAGWFGGANVLGATGALIFEVTDEAAAEELLDGLEQAFSADPRVRVAPGELEGEAFSVGPADVPIEFPFVLRDELLVTGLGEQSVEQAYAPETSLSDSDAYAAAEEALGDEFEVSMLLDFQTLVGFFQGLNTEDEPDLNEALPYTSRLDVFAAGVRADEGSTTARFVLRPQEGE
jgi:Protein of unknown function (DUF3352)